MCVVEVVVESADAKRGNVGMRICAFEEFKGLCCCRMCGFRLGIGYEIAASDRRSLAMYDGRIRLG